MIADYRNAITEADAILDCWDDLDRVPARPPGSELRATARWILQHMITETARHAGRKLHGRGGYNAPARDLSVDSCGA